MSSMPIRIRIRENDADPARSESESISTHNTGRTYRLSFKTVLPSVQLASLFFRETVEKLKKIRDDRRTGTGDIQQGEISSSEGVLPKEILGEYSFTEQNPIFRHLYGQILKCCDL
jgi:hypothetical protein